MSTVSDSRIERLEERLAFAEDTIEALNDQIAQLSQEFMLAKQALQMLHKQLEQMQPGIGDGGDEPPPPHY